MSAEKTPSRRTGGLGQRFPPPSFPAINARRSRLIVLGDIPTRLFSCSRNDRTSAGSGCFPIRSLRENTIEGSGFLSGVSSTTGRELHFFFPPFDRGKAILFFFPWIPGGVPIPPLLSLKASRDVRKDFKEPFFLEKSARYAPTFFLFPFFPGPLSRDGLRTFSLCGWLLFQSWKRSNSFFFPGDENIRAGLTPLSPSFPPSLFHLHEAEIGGLMVLFFIALDNLLYPPLFVSNCPARKVRHPPSFPFFFPLSLRRKTEESLLFAIFRLLANNQRQFPPIPFS